MTTKHFYRRKALKAIGLMAFSAASLSGTRLRASTNERTYTPEDFGARGDARTDDAAALRRCFEAANEAARTGGSAEVVLANTYAVGSTTRVKPLSGRLAIRGVTLRSGFVAIGDAPLICLHVIGGRSNGSPLAAQLKASRGDRVMRVASTSGISLGQFVSISYATGYARDFQRHLNRVVNTSDDAITLELPLPNDIDGNRVCEIQAIDIRGSVTIDNLFFDGSENDGNATGLRAEFLRDPTISRVRSKGFDRKTAEAQAYYVCYEGSFSHLSDHESGAVSSTDSIKFWMISKAHFSDIHVQDSKGFGIGFTHCSHSTVEGASSIGAAGRGIKLFSASSNRFRNIKVVLSGKTGLSISGGSAYNYFEGIETLENRQAGLWLNGTGNNYNTFKNVVSAANGTDIQISATAPLRDYGNVLSEVARSAKRLAINPATATELHWRR